MADATIPLFDQKRRPGRPRKINVGAMFTESVRAAGHLRSEDRAMVELGRRLAASIDATDDAKILSTLSGQLVPILDRLGMSPKARRAMELEKPAEEVNPFDAVRHLFEPADADADQAPDA